VGGGGGGFVWCVVWGRLGVCLLWVGVGWVFLLVLFLFFFLFVFVGFFFFCFFGFSRCSPQNRLDGDGGNCKYSRFSVRLPSVGKSCGGAATGTQGREAGRGLSSPRPASGKSRRKGRGWGQGEKIDVMGRGEHLVFVPLALPASGRAAKRGRNPGRGASRCRRKRWSPEVTNQHGRCRPAP